MADLRFFRCSSCGGMNRIPVSKVGANPTCGRCKAALPTDGAPVHLSDDEIQRLISSSPVPVLVDFYADWCQPCHMLSPILEELGRNHRGEMIVAKVDTQQNPRLASSLGVSGIPAVFLYRNGQVVDRATGVRPLGAWEQMVARHL